MALKIWPNLRGSKAQSVGWGHILICLDAKDVLKGKRFAEDEANKILTLAMIAGPQIVAGNALDLSRGCAS